MFVHKYLIYILPDDASVRIEILKFVILMQITVKKIVHLVGCDKYQLHT